MPPRILLAVRSTEVSALNAVGDRRADMTCAGRPTQE
jgi:hypothetical protein